jgi:hypothetical protein
MGFVQGKTARPGLASERVVGTEGNEVNEAKARQWSQEASSNDSA